MLPWSQTWNEWLQSQSDCRVHVRCRSNMDGKLAWAVTFQEFTLDKWFNYWMSIPQLMINDLTTGCQYMSLIGVHWIWGNCLSEFQWFRRETSENLSVNTDLVVIVVSYGWKPPGLNPTTPSRLFMGDKDMFLPPVFEFIFTTFDPNKFNNFIVDPILLQLIVWSELQCEWAKMTSETLKHH